MQGCGGSCRGGVGHIGVGVGHAGVWWGWGGSPSSPPGHGSLGSPSILKLCPVPPPGCLDQTLPPWSGGELGDHAGGGSSLGMMPTHSHTQRWFRVESM